MYSKAVMQKLVQELTVTTLVTLARDTLNGIGEKEQPDEKTAQEVVTNAEIIVGELRRRFFPQTPKPQSDQPPQPRSPRPPRRPKTTPTPAPEAAPQDGITQ
jgi:hypothetical protein